MEDTFNIGRTIYNREKKEAQILHGDEVLIRNAIEEYNTCSINGASCMKGSFGSVYKVRVMGKDYYVKRIEHGISKKLNIYKEIDVAIKLTELIPNYVSKLEASVIFETLSDISAYLIFEALPGISLKEYMIDNDPTIPKNIKKYETIYCSLKEAQLAINNAGYVHRDIKPANIFLVHDRSGVLRCKLIDFGFTVKTGTVGPIAGTEAYMPQSLIEKKGTKPAVRISHNDHSVKTILMEIFPMSKSPPNCLARAGPPLPPINENSENENNTSGGSYRKTRKTYLL